MRTFVDGADMKAPFDSVEFWQPEWGQSMHDWFVEQRVRAQLIRANFPDSKVSVRCEIRVSKPAGAENG